MLAVLLACPVYAQAATLTLSADSATILVGESVKLKATQTGGKKTVVWSSSNTKVAAVNASGKVTGRSAGSAYITAKAGTLTKKCLVSVLKKDAARRYSVLILDMSTSMKGKPNKAQKKAAKRFCKKILKVDGANYVALVTLGSKANVICEFTSDYKKLAQSIDKQKLAGQTNMNAALTSAGKLMAKVKKSGANVQKNIILCSDGLPTNGKKVKAGLYTNEDYKAKYVFANYCYNTAEKLKKKGYFIYALGFFHNLKGTELKFGKRLMKDLASKDKYYIVQKGTELTKVFDTISKTISKPVAPASEAYSHNNSVDITLTPSSLKLYVGDKGKLTAKTEGTAKKPVFSSSNSAVASVDQNGNILAKGAGKATITAKVDGAEAASVITVEELPLELYGDAVKLSDGSIRLTDTGFYRRGSYWITRGLDTSRAFQVNFSYYAGEGSTLGSYRADGIALTFSEKGGVGASGEGLGFVTGSKSYGVELDSYPENPGDPNGRHVAIIYQKVSNHLKYVMDERVDDGKWHDVNVRYQRSSKTMTVYLDGKAILSCDNVDLASSCYLGLAAATGSGSNRHMVKNFTVRYL